MKPLATLVFLLAIALAHAQPEFTIADLPATPGSWYRAYVNTSGVDVASWLSPKGGPHRWDFSDRRAAVEQIEQMDVVPPADGGHADKFPGATYAERISREGSPVRSWSYYSTRDVRGRLYHGFHDAISNPADPATVFREPTLDLQDLRFGSAWERTVVFEDLLDLGFAQFPILVTFTAHTEVDAWGTVILPGLGEFPTVRVAELQKYVSTDTALGLPLGTQYVRTVAWLVRGIGKAVQVVSKASTGIPADDIGRSARVHRVFESSVVLAPPPPEPVANLRASRRGEELFLSWDSRPGVSGYRVSSAKSIGPGATWSAVATNRDTFLFVPLPREADVRFFQVHAITGTGGGR